MASEKKPHFTETKRCTYAMAVAAGLTAELFCYPFDIAKTRLQIQGEVANIKDAKLTRAPQRRMIPTIIGIIREEGFRYLYFGYSAIICIQIIYQGTRLTTYKTLREDILQIKKGDPIQFHTALLCGLTAGAIANFLVTPVDIVRFRLQMEGKRRVLGLPPRVQGLRAAFKDSWSQGRLRGFYKGWGCAVFRGACVTSGDVGAYDKVKSSILKYTDIEEGRILHILSSLCSGFFAALFGAPADFIRARYMHQRVDSQGRAMVYKYGYHVALESVRNEGVFSLYKGFVPLYFKCGPWAVIFWTAFEEIKHALGGEGF